MAEKEPSFGYPNNFQTSPRLVLVEHDGRSTVNANLKMQENAEEKM